ncbi:MAG: hypothetical protein H6742_22285, partial [Alphaproteobacteria bacterium]|nr:hypothetical protein [Alphaproteobacteria bacterium]
GVWAGVDVDLGLPATSPLSLDAGWSLAPLTQVDPLSAGNVHDIDIHSFTLTLSTRVGGT